MLFLLQYLHLLQSSLHSTARGIFGKHRYDCVPPPHFCLKQSDAFTLFLGIRTKFLSWPARFYRGKPLLTSLLTLDPTLVLSLIRASVPWICHMIYGLGEFFTHTVTSVWTLSHLLYLISASFRTSYILHYRDLPVLFAICSGQTIFLFFWELILVIMSSLVRLCLWCLFSSLICGHQDYCVWLFQLCCASRWPVRDHIPLLSHDLCYCALLHAHLLFTFQMGAFFWPRFAPTGLQVSREATFFYFAQRHMFPRTIADTTFDLFCTQFPALRAVPGPYND